MRHKFNYDNNAMCDAILQIVANADAKTPLKMLRRAFAEVRREIKTERKRISRSPWNVKSYELEYIRSLVKVSLSIKDAGRSLLNNGKDF